MNYYNVEFWKNAEAPRKGAPDKNTYLHAETTTAAESQGRAKFGGLATVQEVRDGRAPYPWACRVSPQGAPPAPPAVTGAIGTPGAAGAAESTAVADAPAAAAAVDAASGPLVSDLDEPKPAGKKR